MQKERNIKKAENFLDGKVLFILKLIGTPSYPIDGFVLCRG